MRVLIISVLAFLIIPLTISSAAPAAPVITTAEWRTGALEINYDNVTPGAKVNVYIRKWDTDRYDLHTSFIAEQETGQEIIEYLQNGQTHWFYITQTVDAEESPRSNLMKITPPITAFIINWPEILTDLTNLFNNINNRLENFFEGIFTPSQGAIDDLQNAIDGLKNTIGGGQVNTIGNDLIDNLNPDLGNYRPPAIEPDDNPFDGGPGGFKLPQDNKQPDDLGLVTPDPDSGTDNELTIRIPYMVDMQGNLLYFKIFTKEQLDKLQWWGLIYKLAEAAMWIFFAIYIVVRFTPHFKS